MRSRQPRPISDHRLSRYVSWFAAILAWISLGWAGASERRRRSFCNVTSATLRHAARNLIIIRAAQLCRRRRPQVWRAFAAPGFRRHNNRCTLRAVSGVWLRRRLRADGDFIAQVLHLLTVVRRISVIAAELAARRRRGLTRLRPLIVAAPPEQRIARAQLAALEAPNSS
ncbi:MAG: hypothetical protein KF779_01530 [Hyphomonadaceae bacterium]|nr:hypothetical protein [Hyphomonadaceae bacterium]